MSSIIEQIVAIFWAFINWITQLFGFGKPTSDVISTPPDVISTPPDVISTPPDVILTPPDVI